MVSVRRKCKAENVRCKNKWRQEKIEGTCDSSLTVAGIVSNNTKGHIKWVICGATVFHLFWLHLDSQSFKISLKEILSASSSGFSLYWLEWWCKQILKLLVILHVDLFNCLSIIIADQNNSIHGPVGGGGGWRGRGSPNFYLEVAKQCMLQYVMLQHIIQGMCAVWGLP